MSSINDKFSLQEFKVTLFETNIFNENLQQKLEPLITDKESYQEFFKFVIWLAESNSYLVERNVYIELLVNCFYIEKKLKTESIVLKHFNTLLPDTAFFLTFFSFLFRSNHEHKRGKAFRSVNRSIKRAIEKWYLKKGSLEVLKEIKIVKMRRGWSHRDILHLAHISFSQEDLKLLGDYIFKGWQGIQNMEIKDGQKKVFHCIKHWNSIKDITSEEEIMDIIKKDNLYYLPDKKFDSNLKVRIGLISHAPLEVMLKELPKLCHQVVFMEHMEKYVSLLEGALQHCIQSQSLLRLNFQDVLHCLNNNELIFANVKSTLIQLLYKIPTSMKASDKKISMIIDTKVFETATYSPFYTLASSYLCMMARMEKFCWFSLCYGKDIIPNDCSIESINTSIIKTLFESRRIQSNIEQLKNTDNAIDIVIVLTVNCNKTSFVDLCAQFQFYRDNSNKELKLLVVDLHRNHMTIQNDAYNILLDGGNTRCLGTINYLCLQ